jgi:hypothetical protein
MLTGLRGTGARGASVFTAAGVISPARMSRSRKSARWSAAARSSGYDPMCSFVPDNPDASPDRVDALVWALTELMLDSEPRPNIRFFDLSKFRR